MIIVLCLVIWLAINIIANKIVYTLLEKNPRYTTILLLLFSVTFIMFPGYVFAYRKFGKKRDNEYNEVMSGLETAPNEALIDRYIKYGEKYGIECTWDKLRGVWFIVNECPTITTEKKTEFRNYLMARGLRLLGNDKNIIDNYSE